MSKNGKKMQIFER